MRASASEGKLPFSKASLLLRAPAATAGGQASGQANKGACSSSTGSFPSGPNRRRRTVNSREQDSGVVVGDHVGVAVLWFVDLQVGVLPRELLTRVDGLRSRRGRIITLSTCVFNCSILDLKQSDWTRGGQIEARGLMWPDELFIPACRAFTVISTKAK